MDGNAPDHDSVETLLALTQEMVRYAQDAHRALSSLTLALEESHKLLIAERRRGRTQPASKRSTSHAPRGRRQERVSSRPVPDRIETARLIALEMMLNGKAAAEVDEVLRETLGFDEAAKIIEDLYGSDSRAGE